MEEITNKLRENAAKLFNQGKFEDVITLLTDEVLETQKDAELYAWRARANHKSGYNVAVTMLFAEKAIDTDPNYFMGYFARACAWDIKKENDKSIADYTKAIEIDPKNSRAYSNRGLTKNILQNNEGAIEDFNRAIEIKPDYPEAYYNRGLSKYQLGDKTGACADWAKASKLGISEAKDTIKRYCR